MLPIILSNRQECSESSVKVIVFSTVVGLSFAIILQRDSLDLIRQTLYGCFLRNSVGSLNKQINAM